jgi:hypothetical protein
MPEPLTFVEAPNFICPTCGYFGATPWETVADEELGEQRLEFGRSELLGIILMDHLKGVAFQVACLHPDGTYGYAPEGEPGKRIPNAKGTEVSRQITPAEAEALLAASPPLHAIVGDAAIEQKIYRILGGLHYACYNPLTLAGQVIDFTARFRDDWFQLADALYGLSPESSLAHHYAADDPNFTALQEEVLSLIRQHYWLLWDTGLGDHLEIEHVLLPAQIRQALAS